MNTTDTTTPEGEVDWPRLAKRLVLYTWRRLERLGIHQRELAEDLAFEAIRRHLDEEYARWDRQRYPRAIDHLGSLVNGLIRNHLTRQSTAREHLTPPDLLEGAHQDAHASHEARLITQDWARHVLEELRAHIGQDALAQELVELMLEGVDSPREQAAALGADVQQIYNARRRLKRHHARVRRHLEEHSAAAHSPTRDTARGSR